MSRPRPTVRRLFLAAACMAVAAGAHAELIKVSPFLPPQSAAAAPTQNSNLEYRGSMEMDGVERFRVVDNNNARKAGAWLKVGERDDNLGILLKQHDKDRDAIVVEQAGQTQTLAIKVPKVITSGHVPQMIAPPPVPTPNVNPAVMQTVVPNPTPADEARRLEAVAAEVARRRALREQAAQQAAQQAQQSAQAMPGAPIPPPNVTRGDMQQAQQQQYRR